MHTLVHTRTCMLLACALALDTRSLASELPPLWLEASRAARCVGQGQDSQYLLYRHVQAAVAAPLSLADATQLELDVWTVPLELGGLGHANWARRAQLLPKVAGDFVRRCPVSPPQTHTHTLPRRAN